MMEKAKHVSALKGMSVWRENHDLLRKGRIVGAKRGGNQQPGGRESSTHMEGSTVEEWYLLNKNVHKLWPLIYFRTLSYRNKSNST